MNLESGDQCEREVFLGFLEESSESLDQLDTLFIQLESDPGSSELINAIFRPVHSLKGNSPFFGLLRLKTLAHELESLLVLVRTKKVGVTKGIISHLLEGTDELKAMLGRVRQGGAEVVDEERFDALIAQTKRLAEQREDPSKVATPIEPAGNESHREESREGGEQKSLKLGGEMQKYMRIPESRVDSFLEFVGEFIIVGETLRHLVSRLEASAIDQVVKKDFHDLQAGFAHLVGGLEKSIMSIRKVTIKSLLQKVPRIVRDIAAAQGKEIAVELDGESIECDKSLVELLDAPLTHMVRNAADHGIELPTVRSESGKSSQGRISVSCSEEENSIILRIVDDGAGLNYRALQKKAEALGLVSAGTALEQNDIIKLLFMAGVSTAQTVSDISGRGVGMDVVKKAIEEAGGQIRVTSEAGRGTTFSIELRKSVTTQIVHGFVVVVAGNYFVLPLEKVQETWRVCEENKINVLNKAPCVSRHGRTFRVIPLRSLLNIDAPDVGGDDLAVTIQVGDRDYAIVVDAVIGHRQLVLRELDSNLNSNCMFSGVTIMGDGKLALVLDLANIDQFEGDCTPLSTMPSDVNSHALPWQSKKTPGDTQNLETV